MDALDGQNNPTSTAGKTGLYRTNIPICADEPDRAILLHLAP